MSSFGNIFKKSILSPLFLSYRYVSMPSLFGIWILNPGQVTGHRSVQWKIESKVNQKETRSAQLHNAAKLVICTSTTRKKPYKFTAMNYQMIHGSISNSDSNGVLCDKLAPKRIRFNIPIGHVYLATFCYVRNHFYLIGIPPKQASSLALILVDANKGCRKISIRIAEIIIFQPQSQWCFCISTHLSMAELSTFT